ncbi:hypothetical protein Peur_003012 [Populus x canadensis]
MARCRLEKTEHNLRKSQMLHPDAHVTKPNGGQKADQLSNIYKQIYMEIIGRASLILTYQLMKLCLEEADPLERTQNSRLKIRVEQNRTRQILDAPNLTIMGSSLEGQYASDDATNLIELTSKYLQSEARDRPDP